jgi:hypothetical protein
MLTYTKTIHFRRKGSLKWIDCKLSLHFSDLEGIGEARVKERNYTDFVLIGTLKQFQNIFNLGDLKNGYFFYLSSMARKDD